MNATYTKEFLRSCLVICFVFLCTYYSTNYLASLSGEASCVQISIDLHFPYMETFFFSYYLIITYPLLLLVDTSHIRSIYRWRNTLTVGILISSLVHFFFPTRNCYTEVTETSFIWEVTKIVAGEYNMVPSIHALVAIITTMTLMHKNRENSMIFILLCFVFLISPLLTHQHGLIDVVTGAVLGFVLYNLENNFSRNVYTVRDVNK